MPSNKRPAPRKPAVSASTDEPDLMLQQLCDLAFALGAMEDDTRYESRQTLQKMIRKCLSQKKDDLLYEALEHSRDVDQDVYCLLKDAIAEASEVLLVRREAGPTLEINAFVIPFFARTDGGLHADQCFTDQDAFDALTKSLQQGGLESAAAKVVLVHHAYHLDEIDSITYSHLSEMVRDALAAMSDKQTVKKMAAASGTATASAIARSLLGWPDNVFAVDDQAIELRFLLGFALKTSDDAFYHVPLYQATQDASAIDAYFDARQARFQQWTLQAAPLLQRCLVNDGRALDINFLYQDLFHGGKERGIAEYFMLQMMAALNHGLEQSGVAATATRAVIGPMQTDDEVFLRVNVYLIADDSLVASAEKPLLADSDLALDIEDACDALATLGIAQVRQTLGFDADAQPLDASA